MSKVVDLNKFKEKRDNIVDQCSQEFCNECIYEMQLVAENFVNDIIDDEDLCDSMKLSLLMSIMGEIGEWLESLPDGDEDSE